MKTLGKALQQEISEIPLRGAVPTVIFDYDGTIANIQINWIEARHRIRIFLRSPPIGLTFEDGLRVDEMEAIAVDKFPDQADYVFSFRSIIERAQTDSHVPIRACVDLLQSRVLQENPIRLFVLSNNLTNTVESGLRSLGLQNIFEAVIGINTTNQPKPKLASAHLLQKEYGIELKNSIMVGDSESTDGEFCRAAGIKFLNIKNYQ